MIQIINPLEHAEWNSALPSHADSSFFHTSAWAKVLHKSYGYSPVYVAGGGPERFAAVLPLMEVNSRLTGKRGVSLPFSDYCEPIVSSKEQFEGIFNYLHDFGKKKGWKYLEIRGGETYLDKHEPSDCYFRHNLDLTESVGKIFLNLRDSVKRNIRKAEKENVQAVILESPEAMNQFYRLNCLTRRDHGLPPQPYFFLKNIYDEIISKHMGFISIAIHNNIVIAANIYFLFGEKATYKYGASDKNYRHLRANNLVMWEAIKWCCENGYKNLCFGRTDAGNQGLRHFKSGWGTKECTLRYYKYDFLEDAFVKNHSPVSALQQKIFIKLPIPVLNVLGTILYKHMG